MTTTSNKLHQPAAFIPTDYEVTGMFYNRRPEAPCGMHFASSEMVEESRAAHMQELEIWHAEKKALFDDHNCSPYYCGHCGQTNVAYVAAVTHKPTGERVCFGWKCCERVDLTLSEHRMRAIKSKAQAQLKAAKLEKTQTEFLSSHPNAADVIKRERNGDFSGNSFLRDVVSKFWQYGSLSARQVECIVKSAAQDDAYVAKKAIEDSEPKADFPSGDKRVTVSGVIISIKAQESFYGTTWKMLVKSDDGNKFWGSIPSALEEASKGDTVQFDCKCEVSNDDAHFGFFKRPTKATLAAA